MATHDGGGLSAQAAVDLTSDSESESSYAGSGASSTHPRSCQWSTERFNDQECSRYFDCPTHMVERALSHSEEDDDDEHHLHNHDQYDHEHGGQEDVEMTDRDDDHSEARSVSPISEESGSDGHGSPRSYLGVSPSPVPAATTDARSTPGESDEVEITGSRTISDREQAHEVERPWFTPRGAASGTSENPILLDDSPAQTPDVQQPNITPSSTSISHTEPVTGRATSTLPTQVYDGHRISNSGAGPVPAPGGERPAALPAIPTYEEFMASGLAPPPARIRPPFSAGGPDPRLPSEFVLPRWQPDAEVTLCPICRAQFSIFVRKHHCRKCGRVVCNACSPHRITIPYQYIVQPPGTPRPAQRYPSYLGDSDNNIFGGGERVRLCNPCVPDPNIAPPQAQTGAHSRSQSSLSGPLATQDDRPASNRWSSYFGATTASDLHARSRSVTMQPSVPSGSRGAPDTQYNQQSIENRILSGTPPVSLPHPSYPSSSQRQSMQYLPAASNATSSRRAGRSSSSAAGPSNINDRRRFPLPPLPGSSTTRQPQPQIAEEDECPVCHRELPPRTLANFEALREAHITICITSHSTYSGGVPAATDAGGPGSPPLPPVPPRLSGMFPYVATEKDCVDSAECTICLEEFEVGVPMARLECLCRFHRSCISAWWERHPGRCPVHQHDGFGY